MSAAQRWKRQEREIAAALGGVRLPNSGRGQPDVLAGNLAVQVKTRATLPAWLVAALDQAARDAAATRPARPVRSEGGYEHDRRLPSLRTRARADPGRDPGRNVAAVSMVSVGTWWGYVRWRHIPGDSPGITWRNCDT